jgi:solute carrier family 25 (mitochondrial phosphate transporter), member 23/24/25/41
VQRGTYENVVHAFVKILPEEGPSELYRGLTPSLIVMVPYVACNFYTYETLKQLCRRASGRRGDDVGSAATLPNGSLAGAIVSSVMFPLEVSHKQMQVAPWAGGRCTVTSCMSCITS